MQPFEIHYAQYQWKDCKDERPWLVVEQVDGGRFNCFPISGGHYVASAFELDMADPSFAATGLAKTCYICDERFYSLAPTCFRTQKGVLQGGLLKRFLQFAGLEHLLPNAGV